MTEFFCCSELEEFITLEDFTLKEYAQIIHIKYCPFCGYKIKALL